MLNHMIWCRRAGEEKQAVGISGGTNYSRAERSHVLKPDSDTAEVTFFPLTGAE